MRALVVLLVACRSTAPSPTPASIAPPSAPGAVASSTSWPVAVALTREHGCSIHGGRVWCWGDNRHGQLGDGTTVSREEADRVLGIDDAVAIAVTNDTSCALRRSGTVTCWGGDGKPPGQRVMLDDGVALAASFHHACAIVRGGGVRCWGYGERGAHGQATQWVQTASPVDGVTDATDLAVAISRSCARRRTGELVCWGLGWGAPSRSSRVAVRVPEAGEVDAVWGGSGMCVRRRDGTVLCQRHHRDILDRGYETLEVVEPFQAARQLASGDEFCAITARGGVACIDRWDDRPVVVAGGDAAVAIAHDTTLCIATATGEVACRGRESLTQEVAGRLVPLRRR